MVVCSDATLLAPEEVFNKKKVETVAKSERTQSEKKALRAAKKTAYRKREKQREKERKAVVRLNPGLGNKYAKEAAVEQLKGKSKAARGGIEKAKEAVRLPRHARDPFLLAWHVGANERNANWTAEDLRTPKADEKNNNRQIIRGFPAMRILPALRNLALDWH